MHGALSRTQTYVAQSMHVMHLHHPGIMITTQTPPFPLPEMYPSVVQACEIQVYSSCSKRSQTP